MTRHTVPGAWWALVKWAGGSGQERRLDGLRRPSLFTHWSQAGALWGEASAAPPWRPCLGEALCSEPAKGLQLQLGSKAAGLVWGRARPGMRTWCLRPSFTWVFQLPGDSGSMKVAGTGLFVHPQPPGYKPLCDLGHPHLISYPGSPGRNSPSFNRQNIEAPGGLRCSARAPSLGR